MCWHSMVSLHTFTSIITPRPIKSHQSCHCHQVHTSCNIEWTVGLPNQSMIKPHKRNAKNAGVGKHFNMYIILHAYNYMGGQKLKRQDERTATIQQEHCPAGKFSSQQSLTLQILEGLPIDNITDGIFELFISIRLPPLLILVLLQAIP